MNAETLASCTDRFERRGHGRMPAAGGSTVRLPGELPLAAGALVIAIVSAVFIATSALDPQPARRGAPANDISADGSLPRSLDPLRI